MGSQEADTDSVIRFEDNKIFTNPITCNLAINTNKLVVGNQKREDFLKGQVYIRNFSHIYCFQECVYWTKGIDKEWKVYGSRLQNQNESLIIEKRTMDFEEFLKEIFFLKIQ